MNTRLVEKLMEVYPKLDQLMCETLVDLHERGRLDQLMADAKNVEHETNPDESPGDEATVS